jgi:putative hydrolase of the HAD superfamily
MSGAPPKRRAGDATAPGVAGAGCRSILAGMTPAAGLILDVEGVIAHPDRDLADTLLGRAAPPLSWAALDAARNTPERYDDWRAYSVGVMAPELYWAAVLATAGVDSAPAAVAAVRAAMRRAWWARFDEEVIALARAARAAGARVGLLSNSAPEHDAPIAALEEADFTDVAHFSHRTGRRKPDRSAYAAIVAALAVPAGACFFVDDKARNVEAARGLGLAGFVFGSAADLDRALRAAGFPAAAGPVAAPAAAT